MPLLLDTHAFLWAIGDDVRLVPHSRDLISSEASSVLFSQVSIWEIALKHALARSDMPLSAAQASQWCQESGFEVLTLDLPIFYLSSNCRSITALRWIVCCWPSPCANHSPW